MPRSCRRPPPASSDLSPATLTGDGTGLAEGRLANQRAVIVLRHFEDLSEQDTAAPGAAGPPGRPSFP
ncbi:MAG TPA: hypothetical protein VGF17_19520, partial [Phytomonospora sp.]